MAAGVEETSRPDLLDVLRCRRSVLEALEARGYRAEPFDIHPHDLVDAPSLGRRILDRNCRCVFNLFEGFGEDPSQESSFACLLEEVEMPFTGNGRKALETCLDKDRARKALAGAGLPIPTGACIRSLDEMALLTSLRYPLFLKPNGEDGSVGISAESLVRDRRELETVLKGLLPRSPRGIIVEEFLNGPEYNAAFLGNGPFEMLAFSRIDFGKHPAATPFLGYDAKWDETSPSYTVTPEVAPKIPPATIREIGSLCEKAGLVLGCRGYFRVDLRERQGKLHILEVNPNPDINIDSGFVRQAAHRGLDFPSLVVRLLDLALEERGAETFHDRSRNVRLPGHGRPEWSF